MKALRQQVERVVRPIRAANWRKSRMREELLGHLTGLYSEELARRGDEEQARAAALRRFGDPRELSRELQQSVPRLERWLMISVLPGPLQFFARRRDETAAAHICRLARYQISGIALFNLVSAVLLQFVKRPGNRDTHPAMFLAAVTVIFAVMVFAYPLTCEALGRHWLALRSAAGRARRALLARVLGLVAATMLLWAGSAALTLAALERFAGFPLVEGRQYWLVIAVCVLVSAPATAVQVFTQESSNRRFEDWGSLDLEVDLPA